MKSDNSGERNTLPRGLMRSTFGGTDLRSDRTSVNRQIEKGDENMTSTNPAHVVTGEVRLSYVFILRPKKKSGQNNREKYSVTILIPKRDIATRARIDAAIEAVTQIGSGKMWGGRPDEVPVPIYDGDGVRPRGKGPFSPECKGHWVMTASSDTQPGIRDAALNPILNESEIYSGMYGRVGITFFAYYKEGNKGVGCALDNVQKLRDGVPLAGGPSADDDFCDAPAAPAPAYTQATQPAYPPVQPQYAQPAIQQPAYAVPAPQGYAPATQGYPPAYAPYGAVNPITGQPIAG